MIFCCLLSTALRYVHIYDLEGKVLDACACVNFEPHAWATCLSLPTSAIERSIKLYNLIDRCIV